MKKMRTIETVQKTVSIVSLLVITFTLNACALKASPPKAWITKEIQVSLPHPNKAVELHTQQLLTITMNGKTDSLIALLDANQNRVTLVGLTPIGIRLFKASYNGKAIASDISVPMAKLPPTSQVLADIMLAYWPLEAWEGHLPDGVTLQDIDNKRILKHNEQVISKITYQTNKAPRVPITMTHNVFGYTIELKNMDTAL